MEKHCSRKEKPAENCELEVAGVNSHKVLPAGLYVVATPIGNLGDITFRAVSVLKSVHLILCEDTRNFSKLAAHYGIDTKRAPLHEHNEDRDSKRYLDRVEQGEALALVSDAGTPLVSDPGYPLVRAARARGLPLFVIPGPCAAVAAISISGFEPDSFAFSGFLPQKLGKRRKELEGLLNCDKTQIIYESPHRLLSTLELLSKLAPNREVAIARELTKVYEEVLVGTASELLDRLKHRAPKGEIVVLIRRGNKKFS